MKLAQTQIITINRGESVIHMSIVQKQSETGLLFNERLFVLQQGLSFGYISRFDMKEDPKNIDLKRVKIQIATKLIKAINHDGENLVIKFIQIQNNKQQQKKWVFKMASQELIADWYQILQEEKAKRNSRSKQKSGYSPVGKDMIIQKETQRQKMQKGIQRQKIQKKTLRQKIPKEKQIQNSNPMKIELSAIKRESQNKYQNRQSVQIIREQPEQNREYINPLFLGYDSALSGELTRNNNMVKNPQQMGYPSSKEDEQQPSNHQNQIINQKQQQQHNKNEQEIKQIAVSPRSQNKKNFKKSQPYIPQIRQVPQVERQDNNVSINEARKPLEFKKNKQKTIKSQQREEARESYISDHSNKSNKRSSALSNNKARSSYAEIIQNIIMQSQERALKTYKQRALQKQYQDEDRKAFYDNVLEEFIRYEPGETLAWESRNLKAYGDQSNSRSSNPELQALQDYAINILQKQREDKKLSKPSALKINDFSRQIAQMIKDKRMQRQGLHQIINNSKHEEEPQTILELKEMPFSYRYLQATSPYVPFEERQEDEMDVLYDWKLHCEELMKKIVADSLNQKKNGIFHFQFDQTQVKIACSTMKTIYLNDKKSKKTAQNNVEKKQEKITDYSAAKDLQIEFKSYCLLNQLLEKTEVRSNQLLQGNDHSKAGYYSSRVKIPLTAIVEYCGFVGLFKLKYMVSEQKDQIDIKNVREKQQKVSQQLNIKLNWVQNINKKDDLLSKDGNQPTRTLILHIDEGYYEKLHSRWVGKGNKIQKLFSVDIIQQVGPLLIRDYLTKTAANGFLRQQLIQQIKEKDEYKSVKFVNPSQISDSTDRSKTEAELTLLSGQILERLSFLILKLDSLQVHYMHPSQISSFFHQSGINIRYMGLAYDNLNEVYAKKCLMTQIAARVTKILLRKTLQDVIFQSQHQQSLATASKDPVINLCIQTIDFLNCILGQSHESTVMWRLMSQHSQFYFKCELNKQLIDAGYFILSLAHHCKLIIDWKKLPSIQSVFKTQRFFNQLNIIGLKIEVKTYQPANSKMFNSLKQVLSPYIQNKSETNTPLTQQVFNHITTILSLNHEPFPASLYYLQDQSPFSILSFKSMFADFIRPQTIKLSKSQSNFSHLRVFHDLNQFPQKKSFHIKVAEIKWYLKLRNKDKYLKKFQQLINMLNKFYGDFCPALGQVYQIFTTFHLQNGEYEDAITFCKSSLVNTMKLCGVNHIKTGEAYYNLAMCYMKANKTEDAYGLLKKAKSLYESKEKTINHTYAVINLKLALLMLNKNEVKQSVEAANRSLETFQELEEMREEERTYATAKSSNQIEFQYEDEVVQCFETLSRCFQVNKDRQGLKRLSLMIQQSLLDKMQSVSNLEKILRVALFPYLQSLNSQDSAQYIEIISQLVGSLNSFQLTPKSYKKVVLLIKKRINEKSLIQNFENYIENLSTITDYIQINNSLENWSPFSQQFGRQTINDFIAITEQLLFFLGEGFLTGALRQSLRS